MMSLYYTHLLIPETHDIVPAPRDIARFLNGVIALGIVGDAPEITFCTLKQVAFQERRGRNPLTGEEIVIPARNVKRPDHTLRIEDPTELADSLRETREYDVVIAGCTFPEVPPLPIDFAEPYHLQIGCRRRSRVVSTSDLHADSDSTKPYKLFGEDCSVADSLGLYTHPQTLETITVPGAGCARFWIEIGLGKLLFPKIEGTNLSILNPQLVKLTFDAFGVKFLQGCRWG